MMASFVTCPWSFVCSHHPRVMKPGPDPDPEKSQRVMQAMLQMKKIDIEGLKKAYEQQ